MTQKAANLSRQALLALIAGVGFNLAQRVLDHVIDASIAGHPILSFLQ